MCGDLRVANSVQSQKRTNPRKGIETRTTINTTATVTASQKRTNPRKGIETFLNQASVQLEHLVRKERIPVRGLKLVNFPILLVSHPNRQKRTNPRKGIETLH